MNGKIKIAIIIILILAISITLAYFLSYSPAQEEATAYLNGSENVSVIKTSNGLFLDGQGNDTALIFYPGAKVEYTSYLPMLASLASEGIDCYLVEMPFNFAFFGGDSADAIFANSSYEHYFISGHSLGGVSASSYVNKTGSCDGLILLASYPTSEINEPVLSIYGSNDKVLNLEKYNEAKPLIKGNFTEFVIDGANHAQYGYYGNQSGDGAADISAENQQNLTVEAIINFISQNKNA